ncbi:hypothetical protein FACS189490_07440 [Clostridia bacterium]|nr:hypothetical protein FACS189490_07440 [Clostridia bacterium]
MDYLTREEQICLDLRKLFAEKGFAYVRPGRFEEYSLYLGNKNFLNTENIITFMDADSRLMSLKPDVTLSIIKNLPQKPGTKRLCYTDDVYRLSREHREYKVLEQIGVELISDESEEIADREILSLALASLALISPASVLTVSYLGEPTYDWKKSIPDGVRIDDTLTNDLDYYNGLIFRGYADGLSDAVLSGGRYDNLMRRMGKSGGAVGFAVTLNNLSRAKLNKTDAWLNVALPKGRLSRKVGKMFGYAEDFFERDRRLIIEDEKQKRRFFLVKPVDVPIYVERGAADIGVAGGDILLETEPNVFELLDLKIGKCRMAVAAPKGYVEAGQVRVATKFVNIARRYYGNRGIEIIHLSGSIELAPLLGLSDVIVDIVETGTTLRDNGLTVIADIMPISAKLIANRSAYEFKTEAIETLRNTLKELILND